MKFVFNGVSVFKWFYSKDLIFELTYEKYYVVFAYWLGSFSCLLTAILIIMYTVQSKKQTKPKKTTKKQKQKKNSKKKKKKYSGQYFHTWLEKSGACILLQYSWGLC